MDLSQNELIKKQIRQYKNMIKLNDNNIDVYEKYSKSIFEYCNYLSNDINELYNNQIFESKTSYYANEIEVIKTASEILMNGVNKIKGSYEFYLNTGLIFSYLTKLLETDDYTENIIICYEKALNFCKNNSEIFINLAIAYEKSIIAGKDENKGKNYLKKMLRNYKNFLKSKKEQDNYYMIYAHSLYSLFEYSENENQREKIIKYVIRLYKIEKKLLPNNLDTHLKGSSIFRSLYQKYHSTKNINLLKIGNLADDSFAKVKFLDGYTDEVDEDDEESLLSLNFDYASSSYYDIKKERNRLCSEFESLINTMKGFIIITYFNPDFTTEFTEDEIFEDAIKVSALKILVVLNQHILILEKENVSFVYTMSVLYLFGKVLYKLSKEEKYKDEAELLLLKALEYFEKTNSDLYPDVYTQISLVLSELANITNDELKKEKLLNQANKMLSQKQNNTTDEGSLS